MDEKSLAYDGGTAGEPCSFPFLMNEKWVFKVSFSFWWLLKYVAIFFDSYYETCTRETSDPGSKHHLHWCPSADYLDQNSLEWIGDHSDYSSFGYCTEAYIPKSDICPDHYHEVRQLIWNNLLCSLLWHYFTTNRYLENVSEYFIIQRTFLMQEQDANLKTLT